MTEEQVTSYIQIKRSSFYSLNPPVPRLFYLFIYLFIFWSCTVRLIVYAVIKGRRHAAAVGMILHNFGNSRDSRCKATNIRRHQRRRWGITIYKKKKNGVATPHAWWMDCLFPTTAGIKSHNLFNLMASYTNKNAGEIPKRKTKKIWT